LGFARSGFCGFQLLGQLPQSGLRFFRTTFRRGFRLFPQAPQGLKLLASQLLCLLGE
jgi:hypothetical protein